jgi:hypothetical protein
MVADFSKILEHPDYEEVISKLTNGIKPKDISDWLKLKYPNKDQNHLRLNSSLLGEFLEGHLDLYNQIKGDIIAAKNEQKIEKKIAASLKNTKSYEDRVMEVANEIKKGEIDINSYLGEMVVIARARIQQVFDKIQENPQNTKPDYALIKWLEALKGIVESYSKIVMQAPDQVVQHNVTVQIMDSYVAAMQDAIRETLAEIDPETTSLFMEKITKKLEAIKPPPEHVEIPQEKRLKEAKLIHEKIVEMSEVT